jgi:hypothetical protein
MSWEEILKNEDMKMMYAEAATLIKDMYEQTSEDLNTVDKFFLKYSHMIDKTPVEWPLMHDYLYAYLKMKDNERNLHRNVLGELHKEVTEGF